MPDSSQQVYLGIYLTEGVRTLIEGTQIREPAAKPIRQEVVTLASTIVDKLTIPVTDQGEMTAEIYSEKADATHLAMRQLLTQRPAPSLQYDVVYIPRDEDDELDEANEVVLSTFFGTLMDFPRTFQERQPIKGTLTISLDTEPTYDPS